MKLLIAIKSCEYDRNRGAHQLVRDTWGQDVTGADLFFFTARTGCADSDEIIVNAPDDYPGLPFKTREIIRYTIGRDYDFIFLCDTGSFLIPHHLMEYNFKNSDYLGYWGLSSGTFPYTDGDSRYQTSSFISKCYPWASGGGYSLSRRAMGLIADEEPNVFSEDLWVAQVLAKNDILLKDCAEDGFRGYVVDWIDGEDNTGTLDIRSQWMQQKYAEAKTFCQAGECDRLKRSQIRIPRRFAESKPRFINPIPWDKSQPSWKQR